MPQTTFTVILRPVVAEYLAFAAAQLDLTPDDFLGVCVEHNLLEAALELRREAVIAREDDETGDDD